MLWSAQAVEVWRGRDRTATATQQQQQHYSRNKSARSLSNRDIGQRGCSRCPPAMQADLSVWGGHSAIQASQTTILIKSQGPRTNFSPFYSSSCNKHTSQTSILIKSQGPRTNFDTHPKPLCGVDTPPYKLRPFLLHSTRAGSLKFQCQ